MSIFVKRYYLKRSAPEALRRYAVLASLALLFASGNAVGGAPASFAADNHNYSAQVVDALGKAQVAADQGRLPQAKVSVRSDH